MRLPKFSINDVDDMVLGKPGPLRWVRSALFLYLLLTCFAHLLFPVMVYQPPRAGYSDEDPAIIKIKTRTGKQISAIHHKNPKSKYTIVYSHGNATDIGYLDSFLIKLRDAGFDILAYDYRGYGTSEGSPSETRTYDDINAVYHYLTEHLMIPEQSIILYGTSLGSGPTIDLATRLKPAGIILESPLLSAYRVMTQVPLFPFDKYRNINKIEKVEAPLLVVVGEKDRIILPRHGRILYEKAAVPKMLHEVPGAGHNDLHIAPDNQIMDQIKAFAAGLGGA